MKPSMPCLLGAALLSCALGSAVADEGVDESGQGRERYGYADERPWRDGRHRDAEGHGSYFYAHGYRRLEIPPGHYPPPGECRVWYPDRPAGRQPPPGRCGIVPPGAWVIRHPHDDPGHVQVTVYEPRRPGVVLVVGEFEIASGAFIRIILAP